MRYLVAFFYLGCVAPYDSSTQEEQAESIAPQHDALAAAHTARDKSEMVFMSRCTVCHGATGMGEGPEAIDMYGKPLLSLTDAEWQASVSDAEISRLITEGTGKLGAHRGPMVADLQRSPEVVAALVARIRSLNAK